MTAEVGLLSSLSLLFFLFFFTTDMVYGVPHTIAIIHSLTGNPVAIRG